MRKFTAPTVLTAAAPQETGLRFIVVNGGIYKGEVLCKNIDGTYTVMSGNEVLSIPAEDILHRRANGEVVSRRSQEFKDKWATHPVEVETLPA